MTTPTPTDRDELVERIEAYRAYLDMPTDPVEPEPLYPLLRDCRDALRRREADAVDGALAADLEFWIARMDRPRNPWEDGVLNMFELCLDYIQRRSTPAPAAREGDKGCPVHADCGAPPTEGGDEDPFGPVNLNKEEPDPLPTPTPREAVDVAALAIQDVMTLYGMDASLDTTNEVARARSRIKNRGGLLAYLYDALAALSRPHSQEVVDVERLRRIVERCGQEIPRLLEALPWGAYKGALLEDGEIKAAIEIGRSALPHPEPTE